MIWARLDVAHVLLVEMMKRLQWCFQNGEETFDSEQGSERRRIQRRGDKDRLEKTKYFIHQYLFNE